MSVFISVCAVFLVVGVSSAPTDPNWVAILKYANTMELGSKENQNRPITSCNIVAAGLYNEIMESKLAAASLPSLGLYGPIQASFCNAEGSSIIGFSDREQLFHYMVVHKYKNCGGAFAAADICASIYQAYGNGGGESGYSLLDFLRKIPGNEIAGAAPASVANVPDKAAQMPMLCSQLLAVLKAVVEVQGEDEGESKVKKMFHDLLVKGEFYSNGGEDDRVVTALEYLAPRHTAAGGFSLVADKKKGDSKCCSIIELDNYRIIELDNKKSQTLSHRRSIIHQMRKTGRK